MIFKQNQKQVIITSILFITIIIFSLLISGCDYSQYLTPSTNNIEIKSTGTDALTMKFWKGSPPDKVYDKSEFNIRLDLKNIGINDFNSGIINTVIEQDYISFKNLAEKFVQINLKGKTKYYPGDEITQTISLETKSISPLKSKDSKITINACYQYETTFTQTACIDSDFTNIQQQKPCEVKTISTSEGQGAPIIISQVEPKMTPTTNGVKPIFEIYISNDGSGSVIGYNSINKICGEAQSSSSILPEDFNQIEIEEIQFSEFKYSNGDIICVPEKFNIKEDEFIRCTTKTDLPKNIGTYSTQLLIKLKYGYFQSINKELNIESII